MDNVQEVPVREVPLPPPPLQFYQERLAEVPEVQVPQVQEVPTVPTRLDMQERAAPVREVQVPQDVPGVQVPQRQPGGVVVPPLNFGFGERVAEVPEVPEVPVQVPVVQEQVAQVPVRLEPQALKLAIPHMLVAPTNVFPQPAAVGMQVRGRSRTQRPDRAVSEPVQQQDLDALEMRHMEDQKL